jgi:homospermidine synthase
MIGFGSIGKGTLPLIERHFDYRQVALVGHRPEAKPTGRCGSAACALHPRR